jgi:hypothetical protein
MDLNKKRREHNTKRVGDAIRGNKWDLNKPSVHVIPRTADKVEPKKPESGSPKSPEHNIGDWHRPNPEEGKPRGGYGGSPVKLKPTPKSPYGGASKEIPTNKNYSPEYNKH